MRKVVKSLTTVGVLTIGLSLLAPGSAEPQPVTTGALIREMIDLRRLAEFPEPAFRTVQYSSYDRRSRFPSQPGWFANDDGFGHTVPGIQMSVASDKQTGPCSNYLTDELALDEISGTHIANGIPVEVHPV